MISLFCTKNSNGSATPELEEQDGGFEASRSSDEEGDEGNNSMAYQPPTANLNSSILEGPYASYTQIASINDELKTIKSLLNLSTPQTNIDTSESVINKLQQENDSLRRELSAEKKTQQRVNRRTRVPKVSRYSPF